MKVTLSYFSMLFLSSGWIPCHDSKKIFNIKQKQCSCVDVGIFIHVDHICLCGIRFNSYTRFCMPLNIKDMHMHIPYFDMFRRIPISAINICVP